MPMQTTSTGTREDPGSAKDGQSRFRPKSRSRESKADGSYYRSLARNMVLIIIIVSFTPMILVSGIILYQFRNSYNEKVHAHLETLVKKHKQNIDTFLTEKMGAIRFLGKTFSFEELSNESFLQDRLETLQQEFGPVFVDLGVVNEHGLQVAYAGPFKLGMALYSDAEWFKKAMQTQHFISDVFLGLRGLPHFIITVKDNWNGQPWILRATIDFVAFNNLVENIRIGETGFAFILNRNGEFQTKPLLNIHPKSFPYSDLLRNSGAFPDQIRIMEDTDNAGNSYIHVSSFMKNGDWLLIYQQTASDAFADLRRTMQVTFIILFIGGLGIVTTAFLVSRRVVNRIAKADREKEMMNEQVVESGKLASVGELAAGIAHEINNPVAIMVEEAGWIEDLLEEEEFQAGKNMEEFKKSLKQINIQGKRCKEITHKLLSFARKTDSRIQKVNIKELIEDMVALSAQRAKYGNVVIHTDLQEGLPTMEVSQSELQQVLLNLINNALDAMEKKGGTLDISARMGNKHILIDISDTGHGIPGANLQRIFDPFFTTKQVGKGTGLGLSICYGIINKLGGEIEVRSSVDVGTTFRVKIPVVESLSDGKSQAPDGAVKSVKENAHGHSKRALGR
jgi:two-component system, NtrC family, sensor kinase